MQLQTSYLNSKKTIRNKLHWLPQSAALFISYTVWLAAFFPGMMSFDSIEQWRQAINPNYNSGHPIFHTLLIRYSAFLGSQFHFEPFVKIGFSPSWMLILQIIMLAIVIGWGTSHFFYSQKVSWCLIVVFALSPVMGSMSITLWKDIPFTVFALWFSLQFAKLPRSYPTLRAALQTFIAFAISICGVVSLRYNGALSLIFLAGSIILSKTSSKLRIILIAAMICVSYFIFVFIPTITKITGNAELQQRSLHYLRGLLSQQVKPSEEQNSILNLFGGIDAWVNNYQCWEYSLYAKGFNTQLINVESKSLMNVTQQLINSHLSNLASTQWCLSSFIISPFSLGNNAYLVTLPPNFSIIDNDVGIYPHSLLPKVHQLLLRLLYFTHQPKIINFIWFPAIYLYLSAICFFYAARTKNRFLLRFLAFALAHSISLIYFAPSSDFRYQFITYISAFFACGFTLDHYLIRRKQTAHAN